MFPLPFVSFSSLCASVGVEAKTAHPIFMRLGEGVDHGPRKNQLNLGADPGVFIRFSGIYYMDLGGGLHSPKHFIL